MEANLNKQPSSLVIGAWLLSLFIFVAPILWFLRQDCVKNEVLFGVSGIIGAFLFVMFQIHHFTPAGRVLSTSVASIICLLVFSFFCPATDTTVNADILSKATKLYSLFLKEKSILGRPLEYYKLAHWHIPNEANALSKDILLEDSLKLEDFVYERCDSLKIDGTDCEKLKSKCFELHRANISESISDVYRVKKECDKLSQTINRFIETEDENFLDAFKKDFGITDQTELIDLTFNTAGGPLTPDGIFFSFFSKQLKLYRIFNDDPVQVLRIEKSQDGLSIIRITLKRFRYNLN